MAAILELRLADLRKTLSSRGLTLELSAGARAEIMRRARAEREYGARPIKQLVEWDVADSIVSAQLADEVATATPSSWTGTPPAASFVARRASAAPAAPAEAK